MNVLTCILDTAIAIPGLIYEIITDGRPAVIASFVIGIAIGAINALIILRLTEKGKAQKLAFVISILVWFACLVAIRCL